MGGHDGTTAAKDYPNAGIAKGDSRQMLERRAEAIREVSVDE